MHFDNSTKLVHLWRNSFMAFTFPTQTQKEYEEYLMGDMMNDVEEDETESDSMDEEFGQPIPSTIDWRSRGKVTPVKNQVNIPYFTYYYLFIDVGKPFL